MHFSFFLFSPGPGRGADEEQLAELDDDLFELSEEIQRWNPFSNDYNADTIDKNNIDN